MSNILKHKFWDPALIFLTLGQIPEQESVTLQDLGIVSDPLPAHVSSRQSPPACLSQFSYLKNGLVVERVK